MVRHSKSTLSLALCLAVAAWTGFQFISCFLIPRSTGASLRKSTITRKAVATASVDEELEFAIGQRVVIMAPPVMQGKQGDVVGHIPHSNSFAVRLDSGSVFNFVTENLKDASAPVAAAPAAPAPAAPIPAASRSQGDDEPAFEAGQKIVVLAPPAMQGKQGTVVGPMGDDAFAVRLESGSVFNFMTENLQDASSPVAAAPAVAAPVARKSLDDDEPAFADGQKIVILGPPAMRGTQATVVGQVKDDAFAVRLDSGSVFHILTDNLQDASGAPVAAAAAPVAPVISRKPVDDGEEPAFAEGEPVTILGPPAMQGKRGIVVKHIPVQDSFAVRLESGSVFNFFTENLKKA